MAIATVLLAPFSATELRAQLRIDQIPIETIEATLDLVGDQASQLRSFHSTTRKAYASIQERAPNANSKVQREALVDEARVLAESTQSQIDAILEPDQLARLRQLAEEPQNIGKESGSIDGMSAVIERLRLSIEQRVAMQAWLSVYQPLIRPLVEELKEAEGLLKKHKIGSKMKALQKELDGAIKEILSKGQYAEWKAMREERRSEMRERLKNP